MPRTHSIFRWKRLLCIATLAALLPIIVAGVAPNLPRRSSSSTPWWTSDPTWNWIRPIHAGAGLPFGFVSIETFGAEWRGATWQYGSKGGSGVPSLVDAAVPILEARQLSDYAGWPFRSLHADFYGEVALDQPTGTAMPVWHRQLDRGAVYVAAPNGEIPRHGWVVPIAPVWPGLLANSAISVLLICAIPLALEFRRLRRACASRCVACGHQLTLSQLCCPECAHAVCPVAMVQTR